MEVNVKVKPCEVSVTRKFNLGNYETLDIGLKAFIEEGEDPKQAMAKLEDEILRYQNKRVSQSEPQVKPSVPSETKTAQPSFTPTFPDPLACLVQVEDGGSKWIITPIKYLGAENFAAISDVVKQYRGEYKKRGCLGEKSPGQWWIPK
jgi:hypothetical protein